MDSILQTDYTICYLCGRYGMTHKHHVMHGTSNRKNSEKYGLWVYLCPQCHNLSNNSVHMNRQMDLALIKIGQSAFEEIHGYDKWMEVFGKNYL